MGGVRPRVPVEPMIALSIVVTALLKLRPIAGLRTDVLALGLGLIHGFGFAGLLQEAAVPTGLLPWALLANGWFLQRVMG